MVEVPTVLSPSLLELQSAEQIVDNPVPRGRGGSGGVRSLQGFLPEQNSTAPVSMQIVDFPVRSGGLQSRFSPRPGFQPHCLALQMRRFNGFFALFPDFKKKVRSPPGWLD